MSEAVPARAIMLAQEAEQARPLAPGVPKDCGLGLSGRLPPESKTPEASRPLFAGAWMPIPPCKGAHMMLEQAGIWPAKWLIFFGRNAATAQESSCYFGSHSAQHAEGISLSLATFLQRSAVVPCRGSHAARS
jgi:hypothetical protein